MAKILLYDTLQGGLRKEGGGASSRCRAARPEPREARSRWGPPEPALRASASILDPSVIPEACRDNLADFAEDPDTGPEQASYDMSPEPPSSTGLFITDAGGTGEIEARMPWQAGEGLSSAKSDCPLSPSAAAGAAMAIRTLPPQLKQRRERLQRNRQAHRS